MLKLLSIFILWLSFIGQVLSQSSPPTAKLAITGNYSFCEGSIVQIPVQLTGEYPLTINYQFEGSTYNKLIEASDLLSNTYPLLLNPTVSSNLMLKSVTDKNGLKTDIWSSNELWLDKLNLYISNIYSSATTFCSGSKIDLETGFVYCGSKSWEYSYDGTTFTAFPASDVLKYTTSEFTTGSANKTAYVRLKVISGPVTKYSNTITLTITPGPVAGTIASLENKMVYCIGETANLQVSGYVGTIEWQKLNIATMQYEGTGNYTSNFSHTGTTSTFQALRIKASKAGCPDAFTTEDAGFYFPPEDNPDFDVTLAFYNKNTACEGGSFQVALEPISGVAHKVDWYESQDGVTFSRIQEDGVFAYFAQGPTGLTQNTTRYYKAAVKIQTCNGSFSRESQVHAITFIPSPKVGNLTTDKTTVCEADRATLAISGYSGTITWQYSPDQVNYFDKSTSQTNSLQLDKLNAFEGTYSYYYKAVVKGDAVCSPVSSNVVTINAVTNPNPGTLIGTTNYPQVCDNTELKLEFENPQNANVQWYGSSDGANYSPISGATNKIYLETVVNKGTANVLKYYRANFSTSQCVNGANSFPIMATIGPEVVAGTITGPSLVCEGSTNPLTLTGYKGGSILWQKSSSPTGTFYDIYNATNPTLPVYGQSESYRVKVGNQVCGYKYTPAFTINVEKKNYYLAINEFCSQAHPNETITLSTNAVSFSEFEWQILYPGTSTFTTYATTTTNTVSIPPLGNTTNNLRFYQVRVIGKSTVCPSITSSAISFGVYPDPVLYKPIIPTVCKNATLDLFFDKGLYNSVTVQYRNLSSSTWQNPTVLSPGFYRFPAFTESREVSVKYNLTNCATKYIEKFYTINAIGPVTATSISGNNTSCAGLTNDTYFLANAQTGEQYQWSLSPANAGTLTKDNAGNAFINWNTSYTGNATISLAVASPCGNKNFSKSVLIKAAPANVTISGLQNEYCLYLQGLKFVSGSPAGGTFSGPVYVNPNISNQPFFYTDVPGHHTVSYTYTDPITQCSSTASKTVTVHDAALLISQLTPPPVVMENSSVVLNTKTNAKETRLEWQYLAPGSSVWQVVPQGYPYDMRSSIEGVTFNGVDYPTSRTHFLEITAIPSIDGYQYRSVIYNPCNETFSFNSIFTLDVYTPAKIGVIGNTIQTTIYPNPSDNEFTINTSNLGSHVKVKIIDLQGAIVEESEVENNGNLTVGDRLNEGSYILTISDGINSVKELLIKVK